MKVAGIIAEYNPFHAGHKYHIEKTREITGADYIIAVMSGDFVQRGEPAIADKYTRAQMALGNGADLVIEIPVRYAISSARDFAQKSVSILNCLNSIDYLCFGSESGDIENLMNYAKFFNNEPEEYKRIFQKHVKSGVSYPVAQEKALSELNIFSDLNDLSSPNNTLGIEYLISLLSLNSSIKPYTIKREGAGYNDENHHFSYPSALSIRNKIKANEAVHPAISYPIFKDDFSLLLKYKLLTEHSNGFEKYLDVSKELSDRICNNLYDFTNANEFVMVLKHKNYTYTRISRCLFHILLNIYNKPETDSELYCRILGLKKSSSKLVSYIKNNSSIPVITKPKEADSILSSDAMSLFLETAFASELYHSVVYNKYGGPTYNEYKQTPVIIED